MALLGDRLILTILSYRIEHYLIISSRYAWIVVLRHEFEISMKYLCFVPFGGIILMCTSDIHT
jgi:hypothetical protein